MEKYNVYVITISTFLFWQLYGLLDKYTVLLNGKSFLKAILAALLSYTTYKIFIFIAIFIGNRFEFIKNILFGNEYLNGKWIGYYKGVSGNIRYFVETIEQDFAGTKIHGNAVDENMEFHSSWESEAVKINGDKGTLTYTYNVYGDGNDADGLGMAKFTFRRNSSRVSPRAMDGISTDLKFGKQIHFMRKKFQIT